MGFSTTRLISIATFPKTNSFDLVVARLQPWCLKHLGDLLEKENLHCTKNGLPDRKYLWLEGVSIFVNFCKCVFSRIFSQAWPIFPPTFPRHPWEKCNKQIPFGRRKVRQKNQRSLHICRDVTPTHSMYDDVWCLYLQLLTCR